MKEKKKDEWDSIIQMDPESEEFKARIAKIRADLLRKNGANDDPGSAMYRARG